VRRWQEQRRRRQKGKAVEEGHFSLWDFFDNQKDISRSAANWDSLVFYRLFQSKGSRNLHLVDADITEGVAIFSLTGPVLEGDVRPAVVTYEWHKSDTTCSLSQKDEIMRALKERHKGDHSEVKSMVSRVGEHIVGKRIYF
jgi:hypothetical protein